MSNISANDFVTFNPSSASLTHHGGGTLHYTPLHNNPLLLSNNQLLTGAASYPLQFAPNPDLSVNTSFRTDINQLFNQEYIQSQLQQIADIRGDQLNSYQYQLSDFLQRERHTLHQNTQHDLLKAKEQLSSWFERKLIEEKSALEMRKERNVMKEYEHFKSQISEIDKQKIARKYEQMLKTEREQIETLHNLELQSFKMNLHSKLQLEQQKLQAQTDEAQTSNQDYEDQQSELEDLRLQLEDDAQKLRQDLETQNKKQLQTFRQELKREIEKEERKIYQHYQLKLNEDVVQLTHKQEDRLDRLETLKADIKARFQAKFKTEQETLTLEFKESLRQLKYEQDCQLEKSYTKLKAKNALDLEQRENALTLAHHLYLRDLQVDQRDKHKLIKEKQSKDEIAKIDRDFNRKQDELVTRLSQESTELNRHEKLVKELEVLKKWVKEKRQDSKRLDSDIAWQTLETQKANVKLQRTKERLQEQQQLQGGRNQRELESAIREKEVELKRIEADIERVRGIKVIAREARDEDNLMKEIVTIKQLLEDQQNNAYRESTTIKEELIELQVLVPKEIEKVKDQLSKLQSEKQALKSIHQIVDKDMLVGISDYSQQEKNEMGPRVWQMMTEFRAKVEGEGQKIKRDMNQVERQIDQAKESLLILEDIQKKVKESAKWISLMAEESTSYEAQEEVRRLRGDFKHYVRRQMSLQQESMEQQEFRVEYHIPKTTQRGGGFRAARYSGYLQQGSMIKNRNMLLKKLRPYSLFD